MKRILSVILVLACLASLIVLPVSAAGLDKETIQKAVIETAFAYYRKGTKIQYDSNGLTYEHRVKSGVARISTCDSPEEATDDQTLYTVCSDWCFDVYWEAFGYAITENGRRCLTANMTPRATSDPTVVLKFGEKMDDVHTRDRQEFITKLQQVWEPGDVLVMFTRKDNGEGSGHAMLYIGDTDGDGKDEIIHSSGGKIDVDSGKDSKEDLGVDEDLNIHIGSVRVNDAHEHLFEDPSSNHNITKSGNEIILLRPRLDPNFPKELTPSAQSRLKYPGLDIDRSTNLNRYNSTKTGDEITVTVTLKNTSKAAMTGIPVTEVAPQGATIVEGSASGGGTASATGITWKVDLAPKAEVKLTYKVKVTAARGATVSLPAGKVDQIPTRDLSYTVSGKLLADSAALTAFAAGTTDCGLSAVMGSETDFANTVYEYVLGIDLGIPAKMQDVMDALLTIVDEENASSTGKKMLTPKTADQLDETGKYLASMLIQDNLAGRSVQKGSDPFTMKAVDRPMEYLEECYQPGDVFLCLDGAADLKVEDPANVVVYVYLGNNRVVTINGKKAVLTGFSDTIGRLLRMDVIVALRPSMARDDILAGAKDFKFTDVKENAWYYSHVRSLVMKGVINGMSETTFAPDGNLTYGQALKLITLAVGESEQAATGSHWASGYMTLAKTKGWLTGNVDLNANITRLQFCQIAAKAAGIKEQPAKNPFTDTADASVLALYNAGIVNGMTAVNFAPNGLLTRAQIAKIIYCLQTL